MSDMTPRQKLIALRDALRAPMPRGFKWDYVDPGYDQLNGTVVGFAACGCAIAVSFHSGITPLALFNEHLGDGWPVATFFGISGDDAHRIFCDAELELHKPASQVLPTDVADVIDRVLAETPNA